MLLVEYFFGGCESRYTDDDVKAVLAQGQGYAQAIVDAFTQACSISAPTAHLLRAMIGRTGPRRFRLDLSVVGPGVPLTDAQWARIEPLL
ncbi:hypothetical protein AB0J57_34705, partial [Streptomyces sp. NPDC049837]|uniref:hypothetical protein n=1 Tax=Streptomyces sp. NPDC049837 TaxID=3155277 RepID=UPI003440B0A4